MQYIINNIKLNINYKEEDLLKYFNEKPFSLNIKQNDIVILKRSIDSRSKTTSPFFVLSVKITTNKNLKLSNNIKPFSEFENIKIPQITNKNSQRPIVVGAGPAGLLCALVLSEANTNPLLVEMGEISSTRNQTVKEFWKNKKLNTKSNVLFGEGGAGMFSDGKLTSRSKDKPLIRYFFETLVKAGAPSKILYDSYPHLGSDLMLKIIPKIRQMIIDKGGEILFDHEVTGINTENNKIASIVLNNEKHIQTNSLFLATGHSARNIYKILENNNVSLSQKPFAMGVRVEMPQTQIDISQNGKWAKEQALQKASFRLTKKGNGLIRDCYSFCMCPGGEVISCASNKNEVFTNGMSLEKRDLKYGNAAFLVPVTPNDYKNDASLTAPIKLQEYLERKSFDLSGNYLLPAQTLRDFINNTLSQDIPIYAKDKTIKTNLSDILPEFIDNTLKKSIQSMISMLRAVNIDKCLVYGPETRSSSPLTITRDKTTLQSLSTKGLYPIGEGSGYAGGIVSSAIDGIKAALKYSQNYPS